MSRGEAKPLLAHGGLFSEPATDGEDCLKNERRDGFTRMTPLVVDVRLVQYGDVRMHVRKVELKILKRSFFVRHELWRNADFGAGAGEDGGKTTIVIVVFDDRFVTTAKRSFISQVRGYNLPRSVTDVVRGGDVCLPVPTSFSLRVPRRSAKSCCWYESVVYDSGEAPG